MSSPLDPFLPKPDVVERFETTVQAPADLVMRTAYEFDLQSLPPIRAIIRLRALVMRGSPDAEPRRPIGLVAETRGLGWGTLLEEPGSLLLCGAVCQPWLGDVAFTAIPASDFATYARPDQVKIAWSLEATELQPNVTRFVHEVRAAATDTPAGRKFKRYWRWARFGIVAIRLLLLPAIRHQAERDWASRAQG
jgi:hypothetical protein